MNRRELLTGAAALAAYGSLPAPADALTLSQSLELLGGVQQPPQGFQFLAASDGTPVAAPAVPNTQQIAVRVI